MSAFVYCLSCGNQVIDTEWHVAVVRQVRRVFRGVVEVHDQEVLSCMHDPCSNRIVPAGQDCLPTWTRALIEGAVSAAQKSLLDNGVPASRRTVTEALAAAGIVEGAVR